MRKQKKLPLINSILGAIVDDDVYEELKKHSWFVDRAGYVACVLSGGVYGSLSRMVMGRNCTMDDGLCVDHINGNKLNNKRSNLRVCTQKQNCHNRSKNHSNELYKGVRWVDRRNRYEARIGYDQIQYYLGYYETKEEAAYAYNVGAVYLFDEYARLNDVHISNTEEIDKLVIDYFMGKKKRKVHSKFTGVTLVPQNKYRKYCARIQVDGKVKYLGSFYTDIEAAIAYNKVASQNNMPLNIITRKHLKMLEEFEGVVGQ